MINEKLWTTLGCSVVQLRLRRHGSQYFSSNIEPTFANSTQWRALLSQSIFYSNILWSSMEHPRDSVESFEGGTWLCLKVEWKNSMPWKMPKISIFEYVRRWSPTGLAHFRDGRWAPVSLLLKIRWLKEVEIWWLLHIYIYIYIHIDIHIHFRYITDMWYVQIGRTLLINTWI